MGWFDDHSCSQSNDQYNDGSYDQNQPSAVHEAIGGAAAYEAAKAWENHEARNGDPPSHAKAKEVMAGLAGAFIDREVETKGLDYVDKVEANRQAQQQIDQFNPQNLGCDPNSYDQNNY